jgi:hypothetical protein
MGRRFKTRHWVAADEKLRAFALVGLRRVNPNKPVFSLALV